MESFLSDVDVDVIVVVDVDVDVGAVVLDDACLPISLMSHSVRARPGFKQVVAWIRFVRWDQTFRTRDANACGTH